MLRLQVPNTTNTVTKTSSSLNDTTTDSCISTVVANDNIVTFDVGGRLFRVRRTLLHSFPDTMLARSACDLWKENKENIDTTSPCTDKPIFIDRDSTRFSCVLDFMRDSCSVDLPVTVTKDSFLRELQYFGFDMTTINIDCITYSHIPTFDAIVKIDNLHNDFCSKTIAKLQQHKDYTILAYICFSEAASKICLQCKIETQPKTIILPMFLAFRIGKKLIFSAESLIETFDTLINLYNEFSIFSNTTDTKNNDKYSKKVTLAAKKTTILFNKYLAEYGLECTSITKANENNWGKTDHPTYTFHLKQVE
jgi:BTB/POZ domain